MKKNIIHKSKMSIATGSIVGTSIAYAANRINQGDSEDVSEENKHNDVQATTIVTTDEQESKLTIPQETSNEEVYRAEVISDEQNYPSADLHIPISNIESSSAIEADENMTDETDISTINDEILEYQVEDADTHAETNNDTPENKIEDAETHAHTDNVTLENQIEDSSASTNTDNSIPENEVEYADADTEKIVWAIVDDSENIDPTDEADSIDVLTACDETYYTEENNSPLIDKTDDSLHEGKGQDENGYDDHLPDFDNRADVSMF